VKIEILNASGDVVRTLKVRAEPGINRTTWGLERKGVRSPGTPKPEPGAEEPGGPLVLPGSYTVRMSAGAHTDSSSVEVRMDPRFPIPDEVMNANEALIVRVMSRTELATDAVDRLDDAKKTIERVEDQIESDDTTQVVKDLKERGKAFRDSITTLRELIVPPEVQGFKDFPHVVTEKLNLADSYINSAWTAAGETDRLAVGQAEEVLQKVIERVNGFFATSWPEYRQAYEAANVTLFESHEPLKMEE
jgi:hypothetical protein